MIIFFLTFLPKAAIIFPCASQSDWSKMHDPPPAINIVYFFIITPYVGTEANARPNGTEGVRDVTKTSANFLFLLLFSNPVMI